MTEFWKVATYDPTDPRHNQLKDAMNDIRLKENQLTLNIWLSILAALQQTSLEPMPSPNEILRQSYQQGLEALNRGEPIHNSMAWLRRASFKLVRSLSKEA